MRRIALYFVIGFCTFSEIASLVAFFLTRNMEAIIFQIPAMLFFYRILCYLYPGSEANAHPLVAFIQTLWRHKL
jgi:hypothetical protein